MQVDEADLKEFKVIYEREFQDTVSVDEARHMASQLLRLYEVLAQPLPSEKNPDAEKLGAMTISATPAHEKIH